MNEQEILEEMQDRANRLADELKPGQRKEFQSILNWQVGEFNRVADVLDFKNKRIEELEEEIKESKENLEVYERVVCLVTKGDKTEEGIKEMREAYRKAMLLTEKLMGIRLF
jgi:predicted patatin/cPLA2 family phospholipase